jgi:hypothetical protein
MNNATFSYFSNEKGAVLIDTAPLSYVQMAERTGLEPATPGVTGRYSNQLNYRSSNTNTRPT